MYVVYCQNKPVSEFIVSEKENYFEVSASPPIPLCVADSDLYGFAGATSKIRS
jgi:hypothetical protein